MRGIPLGVAVVAFGLYFIGLATAPFIDPAEGFHAEVARQMGVLHDWITPRVNGVRYFDKPPPRLRAAWAAPGRHYLLSTVQPERSVVDLLPAGGAHLIAQSGGRWLYSNLAD